MDVEICRIRRELVCDFAQLFRRQSGFDFILRLVTAALVVVPIGRQLAKRRFLGEGAGLFLRGFEFSADGLNLRLRIFDADIFSINFPQRRMFLDGFVQQRLGDRRIIDFAVPVAPVADQVHDYISAERIAIVKSDAAHADYGVHIFPVDVKNRDGLAPGDLRGKARRM